ncbi:CHAP domain-containing protein [Candidatus Wolfebacteria bacterium]|nr:CHAP domain-containing protein [Candidatus Wolfebacteria bacterium]
MKKSLVIGLLSIVLFVVTGCHGGGSNGNVDNSNNNDAVTGVIGADGGTLTTPSGNATLNVPSGALSGNTNISISYSVEGDQRGAATSVYSFGPEGLIFNNPATISFEYDPNLLPDNASASDLTEAYLDGNGDWVDMPSTVDIVNYVVTAQTPHFSAYSSKLKSSLTITHGYPLNPPFDIFNGVVVYSNGNRNYNDLSGNLPNKYNCCQKTDSGLTCAEITDNALTCNSGAGINTGMRYECTEFVNRYYYQVYDKNIRLDSALGLNNAYSYYKTAAQRGLVAISNDGTSLPIQGDILVSEVGPGHVAIVKSVDVVKKVVHAVEQNWFESDWDFDMHVPINPSTNKLGAFNGKGMTIVGWLRMPFNGIGLSFSKNNLDVSVGSDGPTKFTQNGANFTVTFKALPNFAGTSDVVGSGQMIGNKYNVKFTEDYFGNPINAVIESNVLNSNTLFGDYWINSTSPTGKIEFYYSNIAENPALCSGMTATITISYTTDGTNYQPITFSLTQSSDPNILHLHGNSNFYLYSGWLSGNQILLGFADTYDAANPKVTILQGTMSVDCSSASGIWTSHAFGSVAEIATGTWQLTR